MANELTFTMSDMVERVARAMFDATALVNERWNDDPNSPQRKYFDRIARAALEAIRAMSDEVPEPDASRET